MNLLLSTEHDVGIIIFSNFFYDFCKKFLTILVLSYLFLVPFKKRNLRRSIQKQKTEKFFTSLPSETKKRFEKITEKLKVKTPFLRSSIPSTPPIPETKKRIQVPIIDPKKKEVLLFHTPQRKKIFPILFTIIAFVGLVFGAKFSYGKIFPEGIMAPSFETVTEVLGKNLEKDTYGRINILLLGSGGAQSDGGYLTDSIIVASINTAGNTVSMLSIPRDMYIRFSIENIPHSGKINELFRDGVTYWENKKAKREEMMSKAAQVTQKEISKIIGAPIHYTAYIDFEGFEEIIDELGGVSVDVEKRIYDTSYPAPNYGYQTFILEEGIQNIDGETALKYVRSRHGSSDFARSYRQKQTLLALKKTALDQGILNDPQKLRKIFKIIDKNFWTNISWQEMLSLIAIAKDIQKDQISAVGITNEAYQGIGGFLYDGDREEHGGQSVLVPYVKWEQIQFYFHTISLFPEFFQSGGKLEIYNTTGYSGLATKLEQHLLRYAILSEKVGDSDELFSKTTLAYVDTPRNRELVAHLTKKLNILTSVITVTEENKDQNLKIYIGKNFSSNPYTGTMIRKPVLEEKENSFLGNFAQ